MLHALYSMFFKDVNFNTLFLFELEREPEWVDPEDDLWCLSGDRDLVRLFLRTAGEEGLERLLFLSLSGDDEELE